MAFRHMKRLAATAGLTLMLAASAQAETIADAMASAYKSSGLLDQNRALLRAADEDVAQSVAALRPVLNYVGTSGYATATDNWTNTLTLSAGITLYDFGASRLALEAAKETVLATRDQLVGVEQQVLLNAVNAYFDVIETQSVVGLRASNVRLITQELRAAGDRFEVGEITKTEVSLAEARLAAARANEAAAQGALAVARETFKSVTGHYPSNVSTPRRLPETAKSLDAAKAVARRNHPSVLAAQRNVTVAELGIQQAMAAKRPVLSGSANVARTNGNNNETVGLRIAGPIYQGGALRSLERQAAARRDASKGALLSTVRNTELAVGQSWSNLTVTTATLDATQRQVRAAREAFEGVREELTLGARTTLDLLDAEQDLLDAQVSAISAQIGRYRAVYSVLASMGLLTVDHLGLGVPRYDPAAYYNAVKSAPLHPVSPQGEKLDRVLKGIGKY